MGSPDQPPEHPTDALAALAELARDALAAASAPRVLIGITGSPGAGKSTLAQALVAELNRADGAAEAGPIAVHLPMDGFHLANATLDRLGLRDRKGAIETFDGWGFAALLDRVVAETDHAVYAPGFERSVDEPVAAEIAIDPAAAIVVVEGNYLLVDAPPWSRVGDLLDEAWFVQASEDERVRRLVERHAAFGRTPEAALAWALEVDGANARIIEPTVARADLVVSGATWRVEVGA
ncbi:nucleoside/nucleotide kinase family protein [Agromyces aurantiacus]|uniref:Nucleoside/nucleotide kinase family protein n=1 Tax=Agromyces aurantiacus TaxID=165814 RepID=A0ABV9R0U5_9MICO|nr:nucleoside/nucleotide kinase family protein [Agromyces aurantiacus]MBM7505871.1 pantothenate kinase [Agromyces aurantiacus]